MDKLLIVSALTGLVYSYDRLLITGQELRDKIAVLAEELEDGS